MDSKEKYSKSEIDRAGDFLRKEANDPKDQEWAENILENLRAKYAYPLNTFNTTLKLSRMQDIGGLRAILKNIVEVRKLEKNYRDSHFQHELVIEKDYINLPAKSGYRGIHLVYKLHKIIKDSDTVS